MSARPQSEWMNYLSCLLFTILPLAAHAELSIRQGVQVEVRAEAGEDVLIERSEDLENWSPFARTFGKNHRLTKFSALAGAEFFRESIRQISPVEEILEPIRAQNDLVCLMAAVVKDGRVVAVGAVGDRKHGVDSPVTISDKAHLGSLTKSMTATLAGLMVEAEEISWSTTIGAAFPSLAPQMDPLFSDITLRMLLSHHGGVTDDLSEHWTALWNHSGTPWQQRRFLLEALMTEAPQTTPGTSYQYSNAGFALAGHMLEEVAGQPWEALITDRLFRPLGMDSAGFGAPASVQYVDQPLGHNVDGGVLTPVEQGIAADNPPSIAPAGTVHCSLLDFVRYLQLHLSAYQENPDRTELLSRETLLELHQPYADGGSAAMGWFRPERDWAGDLPALHHTGSNNQHFFNVWIAPSKNFAVCAYTNQEFQGFAGTDSAVWALIQETLLSTD